MHPTPVYPSNDFPPYLTIFVTGHVPGAALHGRTVHLSRPLWGETAIWLPVIVIMCLVLLPFMLLCSDPRFQCSGSATIAHLRLAQGGGWFRLPKRDIASPKARNWSPNTSPNGLWEPLPATDAAIVSR